MKPTVRHFTLLYNIVSYYIYLLFFLFYGNFVRTAEDICVRLSASIHYSITYDIVLLLFVYMRY